MLAQQFLGLFVGLGRVVVRLGLGVDELHLRILLGGVRRAAFGPLHVRLHAERADEGGPLAGLAHALGEAVVDACAVGGVFKRFDVDHRVLLVVGFVRHDLDALGHGLLEDGFERGRVDRHDGQRVDLLGDQVFDDAQLLGGVGLAGTGLFSLDAGVLRGELLDASFHAVEPGDAGDLDDRGDRLLLVLRVKRAGGTQASKGYCGTD